MSGPVRPRERLSDAVGSGDRRRALESLQTLLADSVEEAPADKRAALAKTLVDVMRELDGLGGTEASDLDDLAARREARRSAAAGS